MSEVFSEPCLVVVSPGLLGGSVIKAAREKGVAERIHVWARREEAAAAIQAEGIADLATTCLDEAMAGASMVVFASPVGAMRGLAEKILPDVLAEECVVTDVGSVKAPVVAGAGAVLAEKGIEFIGSHPMAGSEKGGYESARGDLFHGAACVITPPEENAAALRVKKFWETLGCRVYAMTPDTHDQVIGRVSHLPHVVASALAGVALGAEPGNAQFSGKGFRDTTRIASGDAGLWVEILMENREALAGPLTELRDELSEVLEMLDDMNHEKLKGFLAGAKELRDAL